MIKKYGLRFKSDHPIEELRLKFVGVSPVIRKDNGITSISWYLDRWCDHFFTVDNELDAVALLCVTKQQWNDCSREYPMSDKDINQSTVEVVQLDISVLPI